MEIHHEPQKPHRAEPDRDHDADRQVKSGQRIEPEFIFRQGKCRRRAHKQNQDQRARGDQKTIQEEQVEARCRVQGFVAVEGKSSGARQSEWRRGRAQARRSR